MPAWAFSCSFPATLLLAHRVQACTVVELDSSGFAENAYSLLHALPMFFNRNGTFYLDNSEFRYKCSEHGGWHDFFSGEENIVPWSQQKETMQGKECARYARHEVDELLHTVLQTKPDLLDFVGMKKVSFYIFPAPPCANCHRAALASLSVAVQIWHTNRAYSTSLCQAYWLRPVYTSF